MTPTIKINGINRVLNVQPPTLTAKDKLLRFYQHRQFYLQKILAEIVKPEKEWRPKGYIVPDQLETGLCTGFAGATVVQYLAGKRPSETELYVFASMIDPWPDTLPFCSGGGSNGKSILEVMRNTGMVSCLDWGFADPPKFYKGDGDALLKLAGQWKVKDSVHLQNDFATVLKWLSNNGPVLMDAYIDLNYAYAPKNGIINVFDKQHIIGGHELVLGGYKDDRIFVDGSWSANHGDNGRCFYRWKELTQMIMDIHGIIL